QVAQWAKEEGIDVNKRWNLFTLKKKLEQKIADLQDQINHEPIKKINAKLQAKDQTITETNTKLQESNRQLETSLKGNGENEKVLEQLIKEMKENQVGNVGDENENVLCSFHQKKAEVAGGKLIFPSQEAQELREENRKLTNHLSLQTTEITNLQAEIRALHSQLSERENNSPYQAKINKLEDKLTQ
ncbi:13863_t:CDS:2, partial [Cetraspora pellucida]